VVVQLGHAGCDLGPAFGHDVKNGFKRAPPKGYANVLATFTAYRCNCLARLACWH
jgi:hypothetical protein